jgi:hypothetical protein
MIPKAQVGFRPLGPDIPFSQEAIVSSLTA